MSNKYANQTSRIGKAIYPVRAIGYSLAVAEVLLSQYFFEKNLWQPQLIIFCVVMLLHPHLAYQVYRWTGSRRLIEFWILTFDMFLIAWISSMLYFSPVTAMPFAVTNSATNYSVNGFKLLIRGFVAYCIGCMFFGFLNDFRIETSYTIEMTIPSLIYLFLGSHYIGFLAYHRGLKFRKSRQEIMNQSLIIAENNRSMIASINYAQRIQQAILPFSERMDEYFGAKNYFILYRPKDIVAGDFYWVESPQRNVVIAVVADCTGHGVSGAFMSLIGTKILDEIVMQRHVYQPDMILENLHTEILRILKQAQNDTQDGMDAVILGIDIDSQKLEFAGAMNPIYVVSAQNPDQLQTISGTKRPIGGGRYADLYEHRPFQTHQITDNGLYYLTTDGFQDQFGGAENKKFTRKKFRHKLQEISKLSLTEQKKSLETELQNWMQDTKQTDDITVLGIRINL